MSSAPSPTQLSTETAAGNDASGAHGFDFFTGRWRVTHRRLKRRLQQCTEWETFSGTSQAWPLLGGQGNVDDNVLELPTGTYRALTLRAYNAQTRQWSIWWLDGRNPEALDVPVRGSFADGVGTFLAEDVLDGKPIRVRFTWSDIKSHSARWQQAFSADGGQSWELNWEMHFQRDASA